MSAKRRIIVTLLGGLVIAGVAAVYFAPWQPTHAADAWPKRKGGGGPARADAVPVVAVDAKLADVPVYLDGVGTARALNTVTVKRAGRRQAVQYLVHRRPGRPEGLRARQDRSDDLPGAVRSGGGQEGAGRGARSPTRGSISSATCVSRPPTPSTSSSSTPRRRWSTSSKRRSSPTRRRSTTRARSCPTPTSSRRSPAAPASG